MPYLEGETLRNRIDREHQLPVDEAVALASKVAGALQHAHEHGVIHRDVKPANILLQDGEPVVADFGIALALGVAGGTRLTETGLSVGTPFYMSPEQATGDQAVGASTDTYALGSVLYEMLVGEPPYPGTTAQAVLGKIIAGNPVSATEQRPSIPANVDAAVRKALEKLPADRFTSAQDFATALGDEHFRYGELATVGADVGVGPWKRLTIAMTTLAALLAVTLGWSLLRSDPPAPPRPVTRVSVHIPEDQFFHSSRGDFDLSRDGSVMVYRGVSEGTLPQLWVRRWDALDATPIRDTERATRPAISPNGQEVAFTAPGSVIHVTPLQGGVSRTITDSAAPNGGLPRWSPDGAWIYFSDASGGLSRLPSGGSAVYTVFGVGKVPRIQALDVETGEIRDLTVGRYPRHSNTGHLLFQDATETTLLVAPFDVERLELAGAPLPLADGLLPVGQNPGSFAVSQTGKIVYRVGGLTGSGASPVWVERDGTAREIDPGWRVRGSSDRSSLALSPDGTRLAISNLDSEGTWDLWVKQLDTGPFSRLTFEGDVNFRAQWSLDSRSLTFVSHRGGAGGDLWTKRADGSGTAELVLDTEGSIREASYTPDGTWLAFREGANQTADMYAIRPGVDSVAVPLEVTEFQERSIALSRDGRWVAYVSNNTGGDQVYVRPFPDTGSGLVQVSTNGRYDPVWAHSGRELFYRNGANELVAVQVSGDPTFVAGQQEGLFSMADYLPSNGNPLYDVSPDDRRFVMLRITEQARDDTELIMVDRWAEELRQRMGN